MFLLILGMALWWAAHLFKRIAPERREAMGMQGMVIMTVVLTLATILMIIGYRNSSGPVWWGRSPALVGINNLLILFAFYLFAASGMKTRITEVIRHPQLVGFALWAVAHLLINGDLPSFVLFGGLLIWALAEIVVINRDSSWTRPTGPFPMRKEIMAAAGAIIVMLVVGMIHYWLGYNPFGG
ncbi:NnrU family protein [Paracoccus fistulariae]|uniref:NnrU domain-containing protein n=1 Tax=Paracoccus fistulariae TaxID=658446 RepID=A0ABY7SMU5_9RHOB|nr:NnrU family protein [Paracoccus fistulariae]MDB6180130.1 NnrU family protein [Paracoccus fistulariae]WCR08214.1 hypothetical protein JHX87_05215 [Paracoccus fistulariae]